MTSTKLWKYSQEQQAFNPEVQDNSYLILEARDALANLTLFVHQHRGEFINSEKLRSRVRNVVYIASDHVILGFQMLCSIYHNNMSMTDYFLIKEGEKFIFFSLNFNKSYFRGTPRRR